MSNDMSREFVKESLELIKDEIRDAYFIKRPNSKELIIITENNSMGFNLECIKEEEILEELMIIRQTEE